MQRLRPGSAIALSHQARTIRMHPLVLTGEKYRDTKFQSLPASFPNSGSILSAAFPESVNVLVARRILSRLEQTSCANS